MSELYSDLGTVVMNYHVLFLRGGGGGVCLPVLGWRPFYGLETVDLLDAIIAGFAELCLALLFR